LKERKNQVTIDARIKLLDSLVEGVPRQYYLAAGERRFCTYVWFHGPTAIVVGEGTETRYLKFYTSLGYNTPEAHTYIAAHSQELTCFLAASNVTKTVALAIQYLLIGHFKRRSEGGTLFNVDRGTRVRWLPGPGTDLFHFKRAASIALIPPGTKPLSQGLQVRMWKDTEPFPRDAMIHVLVDRDPKNHKKPIKKLAFAQYPLPYGSCLVGEYLDRCLQHNITNGGAQGHLRWDATKGFIRVEPPEQ
jgi:hypothetical protein